MSITIVYVAIVGQNYGGVEQKIISQFDALKQYRSNVFLYLLTSFPPRGAFAEQIKKRPGVHVLVNSSEKAGNPMTRRMEKFSLLTNALKRHDPGKTIIYFRHPDSDYAFCRFLKENPRFKIVTEHQEIENEYRVYKFKGNHINNILETIYGRSVRRRLAAFVGVTPQITDFEMKESGQPYKMNYTMGNGIDVHRYPLRSLNTGHPEIIKILFVGSGYLKHGLDRLIKGLGNYVQSGTGAYTINVRIAGQSRQMKRNVQLVQKLKLNNYVEFLGDRSLDELNVHFDWADVALGSLGFHRGGLKYTSTLKSREYFSRGIPFFDSGYDEDLVPCEKYVYAIDADESPINIPDVIDFALKMREDIQHPKEMRDYAMTYLDWTIKMKGLIEFLESVLIRQPELLPETI